MKNVRTWLIAAKGDSFYPYNIALKPSYNNLKSKGAKGVEKVLVTLNKAPNAAAILKHNSWELVFHDFDKTGLKGYDSWTISSSTRGTLPKNSSAIKEFTR